MKKPTDKEIADQVAKMRRLRVKPEKDLGIGALVLRAARDPAKFAAQAKAAQDKRDKKSAITPP